MQVSILDTSFTSFVPRKRRHANLGVLPLNLPSTETINVTAFLVGSDLQPDQEQQTITKTKNKNKDVWQSWDNNEISLKLHFVAFSCVSGAYKLCELYRVVLCCMDTIGCNPE